MGGLSDTRSYHSFQSNEIEGIQLPADDKMVKRLVWQI